MIKEISQKYTLICICVYINHNKIYVHNRVIFRRQRALYSIKAPVATNLKETAKEHATLI